MLWLKVPAKYAQIRIAKRDYEAELFHHAPDLIDISGWVLRPVPHSEAYVLLATLRRTPPLAGQPCSTNINTSGVNTMCQSATPSLTLSHPLEGPYDKLCKHYSWKNIQELAYLNARVSRFAVHGGQLGGPVNTSIRSTMQECTKQPSP